MNVSALQIPVDAFFKLLCAQANIGCWVLDLKNKNPWWSDSYYEMLGIENKNEVQSLENFLDKTVHPDDRHLLTSSIKNFLYHHASSDSQEIRLKHRKGNYNWYRAFSEARYDNNNNIEYISGGIINIDETKRLEEESKRMKLFVDVVEESAGIGVFEANFETGERYWTSQMYEIFELPLETNIYELQVKDFCHEKDASSIRKAIAELRTYQQPFDFELDLITAKKNICWVRITAKPNFDSEGSVIGMRGSFQKIEKQKLKENFLIDVRNKIQEQKFFLDETSSMADVGGWELDLENGNLYWSEQTKKIHEVGSNYAPSLDEAIHFYTLSSQKIITEHVVKLMEKGEPYDLQLELTTTNSQKIWIRSIGKPVYHLGKIVKIRGMIQNITEQKQKELDLNAALKVINEQNNKLKEFTHIVSHNLRSHTGNLKMITEMVELETETKVKLQWVDLIKNVSLSLNETVNNLTGLVSLNTEVKQQLSFTETFANINQSLTYKLMNDDVQIVTDFSECNSIEYVPAYLESIMLNLLTNAIKYKHPQRTAVIELKTKMVNEKPCLQVRDNGLGIDLKAYGSRLFKMNQTFHKNADARGIGLYITKNQVESLGGTIEVTSVVNEGTTFTVYF